ncbi:proton extrusion protein PcxA [Leptolyngbya sp. FACHB-261]|uniref:proton extrusion protein PcxA n=1 Tax=Leptolyngbya sp. FACHB-261 TaxID=2692806 RepID=UPI0016877679|nr:proton extrusion protein PcxA [Leptolyngbya sp. FACHB-261]MBD2103264.1 proton extrusion protein PcxA [Leptolyngbya sp. FACHB-261]
MRIFARVEKYLRFANQWLLGTPERSLERAYHAALVIKKIEDEHFDGNKIPVHADSGDSVTAYFQAELRKNLRTVKLGLTEFKASNSIVEATGQSTTQIGETQISTGADQQILEVRAEPNTVLQRLRFVDKVLARYAAKPAVVPKNSSLVKAEPIPIEKVERKPIPSTASSTASADTNTKINSGKTSFLPRSIFRTANRFRRELDPRSEEEVVRDFRLSRARTTVALRLLALLLIVPLLTQQLSKNFLVGPIINHFADTERLEVPHNLDLEEETLDELEHFERRLRFQFLINETPELSSEEMEARVRGKAVEIAEEYNAVRTQGLTNIFSDLLAAGAFATVLVTSRRGIVALKSFMDDVVYGLSDSAKAFLIILFTDIFVGFHSTHGWEVLLESTLHHFGLPENRDFIYLFIATFPVILDAIFKYWIFRYLNQISPSAVATYRNMNE